MSSPIKGSTPIPRTRWISLLICLHVLGANAQAGPPRSGCVVLVQDRLIYIDMGRDADVKIGDLFQITRRTQTEMEEPVSTGRAIAVDDRLSVLETIEGDAGVSVLDVVRRAVVLIHQAPSSILSGRAFSLHVSAREGGPLVGGVVLYRNAATGEWTRQSLAREGEAGLVGTIPGKDVKGTLIQYCFNVTSERGDEATCGSTAKPFTVPVDEGLGIASTAPGRPGRWESLVPGLYQIRSGRPAEGVSLALLEVGCFGGGVAIWPGPDHTSYRPERRMAAKGVWGIGTAAFLFGVVDSFRDRPRGAEPEEAAFLSLVLVPRQRDTMLRIVRTGL